MTWTLIAVCIWSILMGSYWNHTAERYTHRILVWNKPWWRNQMETFSALTAICAGNFPVPGEFPAQRAVTRNDYVFFDLRLNNRLSKQSWAWWSLRCYRTHYDVNVMPNLCSLRMWYKYYHSIPLYWCKPIVAYKLMTSYDAIVLGQHWIRLWLVDKNPLMSLFKCTKTIRATECSLTRLLQQFWTSLSLWTHFQHHLC